MRVLVACEFSGRVREAFRELGHDAWSCDLEPSELPGNHIVGDVRDVLRDGWDLMVAFPPCTYLASSGARWWAQRQKEQSDAIDFVLTLLSAPIPKIAIENPVGKLSTILGSPDQIFQPHHFGEPINKRTCLWLKNLPRLRPTKQATYADNYISSHGQTKDRQKNRSRTFIKVAEQMALQWGGNIKQEIL